MKILGGGEGFLVYGLHALYCERTGIRDLLRAVGVRPGMDHATRAELLQKCLAVG
jgi:hypothetical protein